LWSTAYGLILLAKLAAVAVLVALAAVNRWSLTVRVAHDARVRRRLVQSIVVELVLVLVIFALVAAWRFTPPPRALARASEAPALLHIHTDRLMAELTLEPGRAGRTRAAITILRGDFSPFEPKEVSVMFSNPAAGIESIRRAAGPHDGGWRIDALTIPVSGMWQVRIDVLVSDFEKISLEDSIEIRR
jgi:copper transport protein